MIDKLPIDIYTYVLKDLDTNDILSLRLINRDVNSSCIKSVEELHLNNIVNVIELQSLFTNLKRVHFHLYETSKIRYQHIDDDTLHIEVKYHIHDSIVLRRFLHFNIDVCVKDFIFPYTYAYLGRFKSLHIDCEGDIHKTLAAEIAVRSYPDTIVIKNAHSIVKILENKSIYDIVELLPDNIRLQWWWLYVL